MTWNYRIVRHADGNLALHEVYYDDSGWPTNRTAEPISFACDAEEGTAGIISSLQMALRDARQPVLDDAEIFDARSAETSSDAEPNTPDFKALRGAHKGVPGK